MLFGDGATSTISKNGTDASPNGLGYSPEYGSMPFTDFNDITPETSLADLNLNWREKDLPERIRTKHVHRLHPYLGKFVPQLVEIFLRKFQPVAVCDPFAGSGTTLVEAASLGINAIGCDISEFNCLITRVKTDSYDMTLLETEIAEILERTLSACFPRLYEKNGLLHSSSYLQDWFAPNALQVLLKYQSMVAEYEYSDVLRLILSRAARSARRTTHFDLDFPKKPQLEPYHCYKHSRICKPTEDATTFLKRYSIDTAQRIEAFHKIRKTAALAVIPGDSTEVSFPRHDLVITSPPYVGLIDYHEQHRYAYELLGLPSREDDEIGRASNGSSQRAQTEYIDSMSSAFLNVKHSLARYGRMVVIINDKLGLYDEIRERTGMRLETRLERHVNRRTGRRAGDFFESILVWVDA